jgi:hypothetical protein
MCECTQACTSIVTKVCSKADSGCLWQYIFLWQGVLLLPCYRSKNRKRAMVQSAAHHQGLSHYQKCSNRTHLRAEGTRVFGMGTRVPTQVLGNPGTSFALPCHSMQSHRARAVTTWHWAGTPLRTGGGQDGTRTHDLSIML